MVAPAVAAAGIGAAGSVLGGITGGKGAKKAAKAQLQAQRETNALNQQIYNLNTGNIRPFMDRGNDAGLALNALLGLSGDENTVASAERGLQQFKASTGYGQRLHEGNNALNTAFAAKGMLQSGAALKALDRYNQDYASNEFEKYLGYLSGQQGIGLSGANALAGVGSNFVNTAANVNANAADARSNAALASGASWNNALSGVARAAGQYIGGLPGRGSSYTSSQPQYWV